MRRHGTETVLTCVEAPTVRVCIKQGFSVAAPEARCAAPGTIFLDGAAAGEPFLDSRREVYNLDHHEGCVRSFTLATCEQAMVLLRRGLDLRRRDWTVYANDPDLDTVLAIWILLNHIRLNDERTARDRVMPLVRLQGAIDAQGLDLEDLCALPPGVLTETRAWIDELRDRELSLKAAGQWQNLDLTAYTADRLRAIDRLVYPLTHFDDVADIEELARADIATGSIAIVCRAPIGIYEAERQLRRLHGNRLGVIALQRSSTAYSLRQADPYLPATLDEVYINLNLVDAAAAGQRGANRWGGSADIGGSPRRSGTRLTAAEIAQACQRAYGTPSVSRRLRCVVGAVLAGSALVTVALVLTLVAGRLGSRMGTSVATPSSSAGMLAAILLVASAAAFLCRGKSTPGRYGYRPLAGADWLGLAPLGAVAAIAGGVWIPAVRLPAPAMPMPGLAALLTIIALPLAAELVFRGLVHGTLVTYFPIQRFGGSWFVSWPAILSAALYVLWTAILAWPGTFLIDATFTNAGAAGPLLGAFVFGIITAMVRERSESVWAAILLHWTCVAVALPACAHWV